MHVLTPGITKASGIESVLYELVEEQIKLGMSVSIGLMRTVDRRYSGQTYNIHNLVLFRKAIKQVKPDLVIFHGSYHPKYVLLSWLLKSRKIPFAIEPHGGDSIENRKKSKWKKRIASYLLFNRFYKSASAIIFLNEDEQRNNVCKRYNPRQFIIPNGISYVHCRKKDIKHDEKIRFLYLGRIDYYHKGIDVLIDALRLMKGTEAARHIQVDFYGTAETDRLKSEIESMKEFVRYCGTAFGDEKYDVMSKHDIFLLTSRSEGMPMGILEALSCGLPCIVTDGTNMSTFIRNKRAGWCADFNAQSIADSIEKSISVYREDAEALQENSIKSVENLEWSKIAQLSLITYKEIIKTKGE